VHSSFPLCAGEKHQSFWYQLGVRNFSRQETSDCPHKLEIPIKWNRLNLFPWWLEGDKRSPKWPQPASQLAYQQVHKYRPNAPWCAYVLEHAQFVAASHLCGEDKLKFQPVFVTNEDFTKDFRCSCEAEHKVDVMVERLKKHTDFKGCFHSEVVLNKVDELMEKVNGMSLKSFKEISSTSDQGEKVTLATAALTAQVQFLTEQSTESIN